MLIITGDTNAGGLFGRAFPAVELICARGNVEVNAKNSVVIAKNSRPAVVSALGVITEENAELDIPRGIQLIDCGNSQKNTVSITSRTADKITLALNRAVKTENGMCEPLELPIPFFDGFSEFDYMSAFAAALLQGNIIQETFG